MTQMTQSTFLLSAPSKKYNCSRPESILLASLFFFAAFCWLLFLLLLAAFDCSVNCVAGWLCAVGRPWIARANRASQKSNKPRPKIPQIIAPNRSCSRQRDLLIADFAA
jgi:hypothetical protein